MNKKLFSVFKKIIKQKKSPLYIGMYVGVDLNLVYGYSTAVLYLGLR